MINLIFYYPQCSLKWISLVVQTMIPYLQYLNNNKAPKYKIDKFDQDLIRWHYLLVFLQSVADQGGQISFLIPNLDMCPYINLYDFLKEVKVLQVDQIQVQLQIIDNTKCSPYELTTRIIQSIFTPDRSQDEFIITGRITSPYTINPKSPFFDLIFAHVLLANSPASAELVLLSGNIFNYMLGIQANELFIMSYPVLADLQNRLPDQKDFLVKLVRIMMSPDGVESEELSLMICETTQLFAQKSSILLQDPAFTEKVQQFLLSVLLDSLDEVHQLLFELNYESPLPIQVGESIVLKKIKHSIPLMKSFFALLQDMNFRAYFKRHPKFKHYSQLSVSIVQNLILPDGNLLIPFQSAQYIVTMITQIIIECPMQSASHQALINQLDPHFESSIINALVQLAKRICKQKTINFAVLFFEQLNTLTTHFKSEYDQVTLTNAQSEHMQALPDRYHRMLSRLWDEDVLLDCLELVVDSCSERLGVVLLQLLVMVLGEGPRRVRILYESGHLKRLVECIQELLTHCERTSPLIGMVVQFLVPVNSNDQAAQQVLLSNDGIVQQVFNKCYMSQEGLGEVCVNEDFAKRVISLYASSTLARKQVEKVIEQIFVRLGSLVDLGQEKIEEIVSQPKRLKQFYSYSKSLQGVLQLFEKIHPERKSQKSFQGYEDLQQEELFRQKEQLFNSLMKNKNFVDALEKIIMSPILFGSKNKDYFVDHYVNILFKKGKISPYTALERELRMIEENYMVIDGQRTIDMNQLIDYDALSVYMGGRYFFRKIIKHISPLIYRGFYILTRFHLIHFLAKMCKVQGVPTQGKTQFVYLLEHLLPIYFLSSQHAAFHESLMIRMGAKVSLCRGSGQEDDSTIRRKISSDKLIPIQTSCLDLISFLHSHNLDFREQYLKIFCDTVLLFLKNIEGERLKVATLPMSFALLSSVQIIQDLMKSFHQLLQRFFAVETYVPLQFYNFMNKYSALFISTIGGVIKTTDERVERCVNSREAQVVSRYIPHFRDAIIIQSDRLVRELFLRRVQLEPIILGEVLVNNPEQIALVANEIFLQQGLMVRDLLDMACLFKLKQQYDSKSRNGHLEGLVEKYFALKDIPEMRRIPGNGGSQQAEQNALEIVQMLAEHKARRDQQALKPALFDRPEIKQIIEMVVQMGFSERIAKKAIRRIEIPEPMMIIEFILQGKVSDDEDEIDEEQQMKDEDEEQYLQEKELIEKMLKQKENLKISQQEPQALDKQEFRILLEQHYPQSQPDTQIQERTKIMQEEFKDHYDQILEILINQTFQQMTTIPLNNQQQTLELLIRFTTKRYDKIILQQVLKGFQQEFHPNTLESMKLKFKQFLIPFGQLALVKKINTQTYKQFYSFDFLVDQPLPEDSITLTYVIDIGKYILNLMRTILLPQLQQEFIDLNKAIQNKDSQLVDFEQILSPITEALEINQTLIEALFSELIESLSLQQYFTLNCQQPTEQLVDRHWGLVRCYLDFASDFLSLENTLTEQIIQTQRLLQDQDRMNRSCQFSQMLMGKRCILDKIIVRPLLQTMNDYGLHNQAKLYDYLMHNDTITTVLELRFQGKSYELDEQFCSLLENLLILLAYDRVTAEQIITQQIKQVMLLDHCESRTQSIILQKAPITIPMYIDTPIFKITAAIPALTGSSLFTHILTQSPFFQLLNMGTSLPIIPPKPKASIQILKQPQQAFPPQNQQATPPQNQQPEKILRWLLPNEHCIPTLNNHFLTVVLKLCSVLVKGFLVQQGPLIGYVESTEYVSVVTPTNQIFPWESLVRALELLIPMVPQIVFFLRELRLSDLGLPIEMDYSFVQFLVKFGVWTQVDRLQGFLTQYISEATSFGFGKPIASEVLHFILSNSDLSNQKEPINRFHALQTLSLLTHLLINTEVCALLCQRDSPHFLLPRLIADSASFEMSSHLYRLLATTYLRTLEPFLQAQAYLEYSNDVSRLGAYRTQSLFESHYIACLKHSVVQQLLLGRPPDSVSCSYQFCVPAVQSTLKLEEQGASLDLWPPTLSKRIQKIQVNNSFRGVEEDASDSESDKDISVESPPPSRQSLFGLTSQASFGDFKYQQPYSTNQLQRADILDSFESFKRPEEERQKLEINSSIWASINFSLILSPAGSDHSLDEFLIPGVEIISQPLYTHETPIVFLYVIMGLYVMGFEKIEKKRLVMIRSYDTHIRTTYEMLQTVIRIMIKPMTLSYQANTQLNAFLGLFMSGSLPEFIMAYQLNSIRLVVQQQPKLPYSYATLAVQGANSTQLLTSIGFVFLHSSTVLNKIPTNLQDVQVANAKLFSYIEVVNSVGSPEKVEEISPQLLVPIQEDQSRVYQTDNLLMTTIIKLITLNDVSTKVNYFTQFPFETLRFLSRSQRFMECMLDRFTELVEHSPPNIQIKVLYIIAMRIPLNSIKLQFKRILDNSTIMKYKQKIYNRKFSVVPEQQDKEQEDEINEKQGEQQQKQNENDISINTNPIIILIKVLYNIIRQQHQYHYEELCTILQLNVLEIIQVELQQENTFFHQQYITQLLNTMIHPIQQAPQQSLIERFENFKHIPASKLIEQREKLHQQIKTSFPNNLPNFMSMFDQTFLEQKDKPQEIKRFQQIPQESQQQRLQEIMRFQEKQLEQRELLSQAKHQGDLDFFDDFGFAMSRAEQVNSQGSLELIQQEAQNYIGSILEFKLFGSLSSSLSKLREQGDRLWPEDEFPKPPLGLGTQQSEPGQRMTEDLISLMPRQNSSPNKTVMICNFEMELLHQLCGVLKQPQLNDQLANEIVQILIALANNKIKIDYTVNLLNRVVQEQASAINFELERKRKDLKAIHQNLQSQSGWDPEVQYLASKEEERLMVEINIRIPETIIIQRVFQVIQGLITSNPQETQPKPVENGKKERQQTRMQILADKKKYRKQMTQQSQQLESDSNPPKYGENEVIERMSQQDIRDLFVNMIQTPQTYQLWLHTAETLELISHYKATRALEQIQRKLNPLLLCFLNIYKHVENKENNKVKPTLFIFLLKIEDVLTQPDNYFDRHISGSGVGNSAQPTVQRTFSGVRENQIQLKIDQLFNIICYQGRHILNTLIAQRLAEMQQDMKGFGNQAVKNFKENDPLGYIFFNQNKVVSFENKKFFFDAQLDLLRIQERQYGKGRQRPEQIEISIVRDKRLLGSFDKLITLDSVKFRRSDLKIKYQGEKGQDEGGLKREWFTNLIKDILESDKFKPTQQRFYTINPRKTDPEDVIFFRMFGRLLGKALYDGQLVPAYMIPPILKSILASKLSFQDLQLFNDSYYESYSKFIQLDCVVSYQDLIECWIPEEYFCIFEDCRMLFSDLIQENMGQQTLERKDSEQMKEIIDDDLKNDDSNPPSKKQSEDISNETIEKIQEREEIIQKRKQKRLNRKKLQKQQQLQIENALKTVNLMELISKSNSQVPLKLRRALCTQLANKIMVEEIKVQIQSIRDGLYEIIPKELFVNLDWRDLQKFIMGVPQVDINDLQLNTEYVNYSPENDIIVWFWEVLKGMTDAEKADFLMFSTGSPLVPFGGFKNLKGPNGPKKFTIVKEYHLQHLIKAHTCFYRIDIPEYPTKEILREKLFKSLREGGSEFDLS